MKVWNGFAKLPDFPRGTAVAVGNFDGIHLGHRKILKRLLDTARKRRLFPLVLTFFPHPAAAFSRLDVPLIQTFDQRLRSLRKIGIKGVLVVPLNKEFAALSGPDFARLFLRDAVNAREVVVGANFRFGRNRHWDVGALENLGHELGFSVHASVPVTRNGDIVSSSLIRRLLKGGRVAEAAKLLGRPFEIEGLVIKGKSRGRELGFPTANIAAENEILPAGVFLTETVVKRKEYTSLTNVGCGPTFGRNPLGVETHLPDFNSRLYGRALTVRFLKRLRDEIKFPSAEALIAQIRRDLRQVRPKRRLGD